MGDGALRPHHAGLRELHQRLPDPARSIDRLSPAGAGARLRLRLGDLLQVPHRAARRCAAAQALGAPGGRPGRPHRAGRPGQPHLGDPARCAAQARLPVELRRRVRRVRPLEPLPGRGRRSGPGVAQRQQLPAGDHDLGGGAVPGRRGPRLLRLHPVLHRPVGRPHHHDGGAGRQQPDHRQRSRWPGVVDRRAQERAQHRGGARHRRADGRRAARATSSPPSPTPTAARTAPRSASARGSAWARPRRSPAASARWVAPSTRGSMRAWTRVWTRWTQAPAPTRGWSIQPHPRAAAAEWAPRRCCSWRWRSHGWGAAEAEGGRTWGRCW